MRDLITEDTCGGYELRRLHAGEIDETRAVALRAHVATCDACTASWNELATEQAELARALPFADFEAGVRRRLPRARADLAGVRELPRRSVVWRVVPLAAAASAAVVAGAVLLQQRQPYVGIKGSSVELIVGGASATRPAVDGEQLAPGERVRIKVLTDHRQRYGLALSVDAAGRVEPLYDEAGRSLPLRPGTSQVLPDSLEFTGSGAERVYVILSEDPLRTDDVARRAQEAFRSAGSVEGMGPLPGVPDREQASTLLRKP